MSKSRKNEEKNEQTREQRHALHQLTAGKGTALNAARKMFGPKGGVDSDRNSPADVRCRVGVWQEIVLTPAKYRGVAPRIVRSLVVKGTGPDWGSALREADKNRGRREEKYFMRTAKDDEKKAA